MITRDPTLWCDFCGNWANVDGDNAKTIRANAKRAGWTRKGGKDHCPTHGKATS